MARFVLYPEYLTDGMIMICPSDQGIYSWASGDEIPWSEENTGVKKYHVMPTQTEDMLHWAAPHWGSFAYVDTENISYSYCNKLIQPAWMADHVDNCNVIQAIEGSIFTNAEVGGDKGFTLPNYGDITLMHLREGIERFLITDINNPAASSKAQSDVVVMWDMARGNSAADCSSGIQPHIGEVRADMFNHLPGGSNVLFMDGHVEYARYPQPEGSRVWALTEWTVAHSTD